jgi:hypothetical protein
MFNFSANNLVLVSKQNTNSFNRFSMLDLNTKRTYLLYDFEKKQHFKPNIPYIVTGKINSAKNRLFLVIETSRIDRKNSKTTLTT